MGEKRKAGEQPQQEFLREAMGSLGMTRVAFAKRISVPEKTLDKWLAPTETTDFRNMPEVVWAYVRENLVWEAKSA
ncbi:transcriptional regulator [Cupriavidus sp. UME77]|uniref:transcriptional regulator n=1 Tax=Cupriavidus sp. UME77 TaxID=1862321 RepID=UPI001601C5F9|nr:transcriptional regulator [Cupriavidus sp. UME77]MBB1636083.1 aspartate carbamoyltransferase catalytic chain [Cupriavidus sp. UME77]